MTARPALVLLGAGALVLVVGVSLLYRATTAFVDHPRAPSSTSGYRVFRLADGSLGAYPPFQLGPEPVVALAGLVVVVAAIAIAAMTYRPRASTRSSTAGSKADAQIR
jgi:divalent metal cation (Fe/Co/Zn/Cd) transporter